MKQDLNEIDMFYIEEVKHNHVYKPKTASKGWLKVIMVLGVIVGVIALIDMGVMALINNLIK